MHTTQSTLPHLPTQYASSLSVHTSSQEEKDSGLPTHDPGLSSHPSRTSYANLKIIPAPHPFRWLATGIVLILVAMFINSLLTNPRWEWHIVSEYFTAESVLQGLQITILLTAITAVAGFTLGTLLALARLSASPLLSTISWTYCWLFRSVPLILQLLLWYNLAYLYQHIGLGIPFGPTFVEFDTLNLIDKFGAAVLGLSLHQAAYSAEIIRSGILSVDQGQREAAASLGIPVRHQISRIIFPQAMRAIVPNAVNEIISLFKGTSIVYVLALGDLFYTISVIYGRTQRVLPMLMVAAIWYIVLTTIVTIIQFYVERHYSQGALRTLPPTPIQKILLLLHNTIKAVRTTKAGDS